MRIKTKKKTYKEVLALPKEKRQRPRKPSMAFRTLLKVASSGDLKKTSFTHKEIGMEKLGKEEPALFLMNHSSFIDLEIASTILYLRPFNIVCTSDGFVGKSWLMQRLGCIPTQKFVRDVALVKDMVYAAKTLQSSILMYPEASYSFDGTATPLPKSLAKCIQLLGIPVVMIKTEGAFARDPLYNMLQKRNVKVTATMEYLLSPEDIKAMSEDEIMNRLNTSFDFDNFRWQQENKVSITEDFRADGLNRVLYKCPCCHEEGKMEGKGIHLHCHHCGEKWYLNEHGFLEGKVFSHIPDWYAWERQMVRKELEENTYALSLPVSIRVLKGSKAIYEIGDGNLSHDREGFKLLSEDGSLQFAFEPKESYSLYSDYYWYELGDMICIGNKEMLFYCFPKIAGDVVAKARLATEELYKMMSRKEK